jgi:hypothetical protein
MKALWVRDDTHRRLKTLAAAQEVSMVELVDRLSMEG